MSGVMDGLKEAVSFNMPKVWLKKIEFKAASDVNDSSPVTVHLVIVYTPTLLKDLQKLSAKDYFGKYKQLQTDYPTDIEVQSWDIVKDQRLEVPIQLKRMDAVGALLYARYSSSGVHRLSVTPEAKEVVVHLNKADFKMSSPDLKDIARGLAGDVLENGQLGGLLGGNK